MIAYLIEESACKEHHEVCDRVHYPELWRWIDEDGPIIRAEGELHETTRNVTFKTRFGEIRVPESALCEDFS